MNRIYGDRRKEHLRCAIAGPRARFHQDMAKIVPEGPSLPPHSRPFDSEKLPPTLVSEIQRFLRVANQIESESPRVAYICRFHAFERAHMLDPYSSGWRVRQLKTALLNRLRQDEESTKLARKERSDARELKAYCLKEKLRNAHQVAFVLSEVLEAVLSGAERYASVKEKSGSQQAIMPLPEIKVAVSAVRNVRGLPLAENSQEIGSHMDLLYWLQCCFGFQTCIAF